MDKVGSKRQPKALNNCTLLPIAKCDNEQENCYRWPKAEAQATYIHFRVSRY